MQLFYLLKTHFLLNDGGQDLILIGLDCEKQAADSLNIILAHSHGLGRKKVILDVKSIIFS